MSQIVCILASCTAVEGTYALVLFGIDRMLDNRHNIVPVVRERLVLLAVVITAAPALLRMAKHYAETERRIRSDSRR